MVKTLRTEFLNIVALIFRFKLIAINPDFCCEDICNLIINLLILLYYDIVLRSNQTLFSRQLFFETRHAQKLSSSFIVDVGMVFHSL